MYADGKGYSEIIEALRPYRTKAGNVFGKNSISDILRNEKYIGNFIFNRSVTLPNGKRNNHASKSDDEIVRIPGGMPRIIDDETWMRVQARLRNNTRNASNNAKVPYLLSGKLFCGACGAAFVANSTSNKGSIWRYYICGERNRKRSCDMPRVRKEEIEEE